MHPGSPMPIDPDKLTAFKAKRRELRGAEQDLSAARDKAVALKGELNVIRDEISAGMAEKEAYIDGKRVYVKMDGDIQVFLMP